jgi:hypothetical protein
MKNHDREEYLNCFSWDVETKPNLQMRMSTFLAVNAVFRNRIHPTTFPIPSTSCRENVTAGNFVKIAVKCEAKVGVESERFWVDVLDKRDDGIFVGKVANALVQVPLDFDSIITFHVDCILDIMQEPSELEKLCYETYQKADSQTFKEDETDQFQDGFKEAIKTIMRLKHSKTTLASTANIGSKEYFYGFIKKMEYWHERNQTL